MTLFICIVKQSLLFILFIKQSLGDYSIITVTSNFIVDYKYNFTITSSLHPRIVTGESLHPGGSHCILEDIDRESFYMGVIQSYDTVLAHFFVPT